MAGAIHSMKTHRTYEEMHGEEKAKYLRNLFSLQRSGKNHPLYGKHHSEETRKKMSERKKGDKCYNWGKKLSEETRKKLSLSWTEERKKKYSERMSGKNHPFFGKRISENRRKNISDKAKIRFKNKENHPMYGRFHSEEAKRKVSETKKRLYKEGKIIPSFPKGCKRPEMSGERNPMFGKRGILSPNYGKKFTEELKLKFSEMKKGKNNPMFGVPTPHTKHFFVPELGHSVRSSWEEEIAFILKSNNIPYGYETMTFYLGNMTYTPDFILNTKAVIEVKGYLTEENIIKLKLFKKLYPEILLIGIGTGIVGLYDVHLNWNERFYLSEMSEGIGGNNYEIQQANHVI
jgi:hypothetical protein